MTYELLLQGGKVVKWDGSDGKNAAERYVDCHREAAVVAWREPRYGFFPGVDPNQIIG
jgi:hypothetical protein